MRFYLLLLPLLLAAGDAPTPPAAAPLVIAGSALTLDKATLAPVPGTDRRGALFGVDDASATTTLRLPPGRYQIVLHLYSVDDDHDSLFVDVGDQQYSVFAVPHEAVVEHSRNGIEENEPSALPLTVANAPVALTLRSKETGVIVDHIEVRAVK